jgi:enoyl-[acyl-carrier protein] reductase I
MLTEKPFEGKKALILGVANERSLAWSIAQHLHAGGAQLGFKSSPPVMSLKTPSLTLSLSRSVTNGDISTT